MQLYDELLQNESAFLEEHKIKLRFDYITLTFHRACESDLLIIKHLIFSVYGRELDFVKLSVVKSRMDADRELAKEKGVYGSKLFWKSYEYSGEGYCSNYIIIFIPGEVAQEFIEKQHCNKVDFSDFKVNVTRLDLKVSFPASVVKTREIIEVKKLLYNVFTKQYEKELEEAEPRNCVFESNSKGAVIRIGHRSSARYERVYTKEKKLKKDETVLNAVNSLEEKDKELLESPVVFGSASGWESVCDSCYESDCVNAGVRNSMDGRVSVAEKGKGGLCCASEAGKMVDIPLHYEVELKRAVAKKLGVCLLRFDEEEFYKGAFNLLITQINKWSRSPKLEKLFLFKEYVEKLKGDLVKLKEIRVLYEKRFLGRIYTSIDIPFVSVLEDIITGRTSLPKDSLLFFWGLLDYGHICAKAQWEKKEYISKCMSLQENLAAKDFSCSPVLVELDVEDFFEKTGLNLTATSRERFQQFMWAIDKFSYNYFIFKNKSVLSGCYKLCKTPEKITNKIKKRTLITGYKLELNMEVLFRVTDKTVAHEPFLFKNFTYFFQKETNSKKNINKWVSAFIFLLSRLASGADEIAFASIKLKMPRQEDKEMAAKVVYLTLVFFQKEGFFRTLHVFHAVSDVFKKPLETAWVETNVLDLFTNPAKKKCSYIRLRN